MIVVPNLVEYASLIAYLIQKLELVVDVTSFLISSLAGAEIEELPARDLHGAIFASPRQRLGGLPRQYHEHWITLDLRRGHATEPNLSY